MSDLRPAALSILREGRLQLTQVTTDDLGNPQRIVGVIHGHSGVHAVDWMDRDWSCTCGPWMRGQRRPCAHIHAVQLVTLPIDVPVPAGAR